MITTIKIAEETKKRLLSLDLADKGKTFDMIVNELISSYQNNIKKWVNAVVVYLRYILVYLHVC